MAARIAAAIREQTVFIAEAGTGTGKTFAYLVPALASGGKVIISTGTKTLQDQLFNKDLPLVRHALKAPVQVALLKGRANYVCHYYLRRAVEEGRFHSREEVSHLAKIQRFSRSPARATRANVATCPKVRRSGMPSLPPATTASGRNARTTRTASSWPRAAKPWRRIWWWSITTSSLPT